MTLPFSPVESAGQFLNEALSDVKQRSGLNERQLGGVGFGFVLFIWLSIRVLVRLLFGGRKRVRPEKNPEPEAFNTMRVETIPKQAMVQSEISAAPPPSVVPPAQTPSSTTTVSSPPSSPDHNSPASPQVLHTGSLKKRSILSSSLTTIELLREDEHNVAILYTLNSGALSPSKAKQKSFYLGTESHIETSSKLKFTVHQLKSGGKKLSLEAKTPEEREIWIKKIQDAIDSLKLQRRY